MSYVRMDGTPTSADDPNRFVWYGSSCTYWTDDTDNLSRTASHIPCCPKCGGVGFQSTYDELVDPAALKKYEDDGHPGYAAAFLWGKERCYRSTEHVMQAHRTFAEAERRIVERAREMAGMEKFTSRLRQAGYVTAFRDLIAWIEGDE